jgi:hypothetical protein
MVLLLRQRVAGSGSMTELEYQGRLSGSALPVNYETSKVRVLTRIGREWPVPPFGNVVEARGLDLAS